VKEHLGRVETGKRCDLLLYPSEGKRTTNMTIDSPTVSCRVLDESVNYIRNSFSVDAPVRKVYELLDKEFEPTVSNDLNPLCVSYGRDRAYA
jgi:hypothetical protein